MLHIIIIINAILLHKAFIRGGTIHRRCRKHSEREEERKTFLCVFISHAFTLFVFVVFLPTATSSLASGAHTNAHTCKQTKHCVGRRPIFNKNQRAKRKDKEMEGGGEAEKERERDLNDIVILFIKHSCFLFNKFKWACILAVAAVVAAATLAPSGLCISTAITSHNQQLRMCECVSALEWVKHSHTLISIEILYALAELTILKLKSSISNGIKLANSATLAVVRFNYIFSRDETNNNYCSFGVGVSFEFRSIGRSKPKLRGRCTEYNAQCGWLSLRSRLCHLIHWINNVLAVHTMRW